MRHKILAIFDSARFRRETLLYATELAKRVESNLNLLVILALEERQPGGETAAHAVGRGRNAQAILAREVVPLRRRGIFIETTVRIGNPRSELTKYLAETGRFDIIVWGGSADLLKQKDHWLTRMKGNLACPVVAPFEKKASSSSIERREGL